VTLWGTGSAFREFMHVDDLAEAVLFIMERWDSPEIINVGTGQDISIRSLAEMIADQCGYTGAIEWDATKPDGMPRKLMDVAKLTQLGYRSKIPLEAGVREMISAYSAFKHSVDKDKVNDSFDEKHVSQGTGNPSSTVAVHSGCAAA
jgi:GDP-L-fucose synthase